MRTHVNDYCNIVTDAHSKAYNADTPEITVPRFRLRLDIRQAAELGAALLQAAAVAQGKALPNLADYVKRTARLTKDGGCATCGKDGYDDNPACADHQAFDMPNDDAVSTLHDLIEEARGIVEDMTK